MPGQPRTLVHLLSEEPRFFAAGSNRCILAVLWYASFRTGQGDVTMELSRLASFAVILSALLALSACANTARGAVKDVTTTVDAAVE